MAKGINKVFLLGNVGKDPEVRATNGGTIVATFSLATADRRKDSRGEWQDATEWHTCVAFGRTAEIIRDYAPKGARLHLEGKLQTRSWEDRESGQKRYRTEILVNEVTLLGGGKARETRSDADDAEQPGYGYTRTSEVTDDDIPF